MASSSSAAAADLAGGDGEVGGLGDQSVRGSGVMTQPVAVVVGGGDDQDTDEMDFTMKLNEDLKANMQGFHKDAVDILETQIGVKKMHSQQLASLLDTVEPRHALLEKSIRMAQMSLLCSSSKLGDESLTEKSGAAMKVDKSKELEQEVAKLDAEIDGKMRKLSEMLEGSLSHDLFSSALSKYLETNMELQDARKELVQVFNEMTFKHAVIRIKVMGELHHKPFADACRWKYGETDDECRLRAAELTSVWQDEVRNPSWHPFRIVEDANGKPKQVVDDDDAKLRRLRDEYGDGVRDAVVAAATEMNEHNASGGYPVCELWNYGEGRKATVKDALRELVGQLKSKKRRLN